MRYLNNLRFRLTIIALIFSQSLFSQNTNRGNIFFNQIKFDTISINKFDSLMNDLGKVKFISGYLYFSGAGFPNTLTSFFHSKGNHGFGQSYLSYFNRCKAGSKITFEKCVIRLNDSTFLKAYNKSIFIKK
jgi:hypothetical protein